MIEGGQGRSPAEVEADASMMVIVWVAGAVALAAGAVFWWLF